MEYSVGHGEGRLLVLMDSFRSNTYLDSLRQLAPELDVSDRTRLELARFPTIERVVTVGGAQQAGTYTYQELLASGGDRSIDDLARCRAEASFQDLAFILYTAGSGGAAKGVMMRQGQCIENAYAIGERQRMGPSERLWLAVSLAWSFGAANALPAIMSHGGTIVLQEVFEPGEALRIFEAERISVVYTISNMVNALVTHPDLKRFDRSTLRTGVTTGLPEEIRRAIEDLGASQICQATGGTETYGNCCVSDALEPPEIRMTSNGRPPPRVEGIVVDPVTRLPGPTGQIGEFTVRGKYLSPGYWHDPERTAEHFRDGTYVPGDLAFFDDDGRVHFVGRVNEMIKTGGINVSPAEVENFLVTHPAIREAYVFGVPHEEKGEIAVACVQLADGANLTVPELLAYCRERIATFKIPSRVEFVTADEIPHTSTGKVNRRLLVDRYRAASATDGRLPTASR